MPRLRYLKCQRCGRALATHEEPERTCDACLRDTEIALQTSAIPPGTYDDITTLASNVAGELHTLTERGAP